MRSSVRNFLASATRPALDATSTIPIVMAQDNDPVGSGIVASLARPGGNVTGLSTLVPELSAKQLALLSEMVPGLARVAIFGDTGEAGDAQSVAEAERAGAPCLCRRVPICSPVRTRLSPLR